MNPPALFLGLGVGVHAGEGLNQGGLAVVDVARQADDYLTDASTPSIALARRSFFSMGMALRSM